MFQCKIFFFLFNCSSWIFKLNLFHRFLGLTYLFLDEVMFVVSHRMLLVLNLPNSWSYFGWNTFLNFGKYGFALWLVFGILNSVHQVLHRCPHPQYLFWFKPPDTYMVLGSIMRRILLYFEPSPFYRSCSGTFRF